MTPAINVLRKTGIKYQIHKYQHDGIFKSYGEEAGAKLNISFDRLFKTLVTIIDNDKFAIALVPVSKKLDLKLFAKVLKSKKAKLSDKKDVECITGYIIGGVSPIGQKKKLKTVIDRSALKFNTIYVSAGRRGLQIELSPKDLGLCTDAMYDKISK